MRMSIVTTLRRGFDTDTLAEQRPAPDRIAWLRVLPFGAMHLLYLGVIWVRRD